METSLFSKGDIKAYELEELKGKTLEIVAAGVNEGIALVYGRDITTDVIYVIGANNFKQTSRMKSDDIQVDTFESVDFSGLKFPTIVVYDHPKDYPFSYVARIWDKDQPTNVLMQNEDLESIRKMIPCNMILMNRSENDDNCIIETWI